MKRQSHTLASTDRRRIARLEEHFGYIPHLTERVAFFPVCDRFISRTLGISNRDRDHTALEHHAALYVSWTMLVLTAVLAHSGQRSPYGA